MGTQDSWKLRASSIGNQIRNFWNHCLGQATIIYKSSEAQEPWFGYNQKQRRQWGAWGLFVSAVTSTRHSGIRTEHNSVESSRPKSRQIRRLLVVGLNSGTDQMTCSETSLRSPKSPISAGQQYVWGKASRWRMERGSPVLLVKYGDAWFKTYQACGVALPSFWRRTWQWYKPK